MYNAAEGLPYTVNYGYEIYSMRFFDIDIWQPNTLLTTSRSSFYLQIFGENKRTQIISDPLDEKYFVHFDKIHSFYYDTYDDWARCSAETGCVELTTTEEERSALVDFYWGFNGHEWRMYDNWLTGDPCLNQWYGV